MRICLCMIVKNEAAVLSRCLAAAMPHIHSWAITDTGSTDSTPMIAQGDLYGLPGKLSHAPFLDFAQARNAALEHARSLSDWDYALLLDADMILTGSLPDKLTAPAYRFVQRNGNLEYWNTRLVRRDAPAKYIGVTHEYLSVDGEVNLPGLLIDDRNDGGSRGDKGPRDIRLLLKGLEDEPDNGRYMFYLANTYRDTGSLGDAILWYTRRIAAGGWDEEIWASYYGIAQCYRLLGLEASFVSACLDAYNIRPTRPEPLALLARWYREHGKSEAACLLTEKLRTMPPSKDILFVERDIQKRADVDTAISGFYSQLPSRVRDGYDACARLTIDPDPILREEARLNFTHYAKSAEELYGAELRPIAFEAPEGWAPMNPSVIVHGRRRLCLVRTVNYRVTEGQYPTHDGSGVIRTQNYLLEMDSSWVPIERTPIVDATGLPRTNFPVEGFEDCRLYPTAEGFAASAVVRDLGDGRCEQAILTFDPRWRVTRIDVVRDYQHDRTQKNWMPVVGSPGAVLYLCHPTLVLDTATPQGTVEVSCWAPIDIDLTELRGGSQLIPHRDGWLCLVHEVIWNPGRIYLHRFVRLNAGFRIEAVSRPFFFQHKGIEFCAGLARDGDRLVASYGVNDASAHLAFFDPNAIDKELA